MAEGTGKYWVEQSQQDSDAGKMVRKQVTNFADHFIPGGSGGTANTDLGSLPATMSTHTGNGSGTEYNMPSGRVSVQATASDNGGTFTSGSIDVECSDDNIGWFNVGTINLAGNGDSDGVAPNAPHAYIRTTARDMSVSGSTPNIITTINL